MLWVRENINEVLEKLKTDKTLGLNQQEIDSRLKRYGANEFEEEKKDTLMTKVIHHLSEIPTLILIAAAAIAGYTAIFHPPDTIGRGWPKVVVILSIVIINVTLGIWQES